jgi:hypothetical protein
MMKISKLKAKVSEEGVTQFSLENFHDFLQRGFKPIAMVHKGYSDKAEYYTRIYFTREESNYIYYHLFTGLASGYSGTGPKGLMEVVSKSGFKGLNYMLITQLEDLKEHTYILDSESESLLLDSLIIPQITDNLIENYKRKNKAKLSNGGNE